jgi:prolyl-tRNA synthetase
LQACTSHYFAQRFANAFDIKFQNRQGQQQFVEQTSWGMSTRIVGALIMTHSDDQGLVLPPNAAPTQIVIVPILQKNKDNTQVLEVSRRLQSELMARHTVYLDDREGQSPGFKFNEWEIQGVPLRIEVGPRDLANGICVIARRDGQKSQVKLEEVVGEAGRQLSDFQKALLDRATKFLYDNVHLENEYGAFKTRLEENAGFYQMHWCGKAECEAKVKEETKATIRNIPFEQIKEMGKCILCNGPSAGRVVFGRAY